MHSLEPEPSKGRIQEEWRAEDEKVLTKKIKQWLICVQLNFHDNSCSNGNRVTLTKEGLR